MKQNKNSLIKVAFRIRELRKEKNLTLQDIASLSGLSKGLLSKIENFRTIPSLPVLVTISNCLKVDVSELVADLGSGPETKYTLVKAESREIVSREDAVGFQYENAVTQQIKSCFFESMVLTIKPRAERQAVTSDGDQFIFILSGDIIFQLDDERIPMQTGDALLFDGQLPHKALNISNSDGKILAIYLLNN